jgi:hypothetical protein
VRAAAETAEFGASEPGKNDVAGTLALIDERQGAWNQKDARYSPQTTELKRGE